MTARTLSPETIRFRLWQLRLSDPEISQKDASTEIGCSVEQLRAAQPSGWRWGGQQTRNGSQPEEVDCTAFMAGTAHYIGLRAFRNLVGEVLL